MKRLHLRFTKAGYTLLTGFLISSALNADTGGGLFVEPSISYEIGESNTNYPTPFNDSTGKIEGLGLGARLGFHINEAFFLGADFRYSMPDFKDTSNGYSTKSVSTNWGPVVGLQMPNAGMRVWGSYILEGELNPEENSGLDLKFKAGKGFRVGAGVKVAVVSLNLEYQQLKYDDVELEQFGPFAPASTVDNTSLEDKAWLIGVSFPLAL